MKKQHRKIGGPRRSRDAFAFAPVARGANKLEVRNESDSSEIVLIGTIGKSWWDDSGITEKEFRDALKSIPIGRSINVKVNSEGGSVSEGLGIYNAIRERNADIKVHITGYALSIASVFPLAAKKSLGGRGVVSPQSAIWMQHKAWSWAQGNSDDMRQAAEMLDAHDETLVDIYATATGKSKADIRAIMENETWTKGADAIAAGLADETDEPAAPSQAAYRPLTPEFIKRCKNLSPVILNLISAPPPGAATQNQNTLQDTMNKKIVVAVLKKHGIEASETETEEQLQAKLEKIPTTAATPPAPAPAAAAAASNGVDIQAELALIKRNRIADKMDDYVAAGKITKDETEIWIVAALKDEASTFKILDAKTAQSPGGAAAGVDFQVNEPDQHPVLAGRPTEKLINLARDCGNDRAKIYDAMKRDYNLLIGDAMRRDRVRNDNTFTSTFTTNFLIMGATTKASPKFASVRMFSRDTSVDPIKPLASGVMKYTTNVQDGSTAQTDATNFESGDGTVTPVTVAVHQYTESFHVTNKELNSGLRMEDLAESKLASLGSKVSQIMGAYITAANFSTLSPIISSTGAFTFSDMATAWGELKKANRKHIMLDGEYLARVINSPVFLQSVPVVPGAGWKNVIGWDYVALHTEWSAAGTNIHGFACDPQAVGVIAGVPIEDSAAIPGGILARASAMIPGVDLPITVYAWFNTSTRTYWASYDIMFGANALDTTVGVPIATGTPS